MNITQILNTVCDETLQPRTVLPASLSTITDPSSLQRLAFYNATLRDLLQARCWVQLKKAYTFSTVNAQSDYTLPADFYSGIFGPAYDIARRLPLVGPISDEFANWELYGGGNYGGLTQYRIFGLPNTGQFKIFPTPTGVRSITFYYISKYCVFENPTWVELPTSNTAEAAFDDELMLLGTKWRQLRELGQVYDDVKREYQDKIDQAKNRFNGTVTGSLTRYFYDYADFNYRYRPVLGGWNI